MSLDAIIAGGGPAGSLAALLLRRQGVHVGLVEAGGTAARIEGLSARGLGVLQAQGLAEVAALASPPIRRQARWGGVEAAPNSEHLVERSRFDAALRRAAEAAGVQVIRDRVRRRLTGALELEQAGRIAAGLVVEARGRRAAAGKGRHLGPRSLALAGRCGTAEAAEVSLAATPEGWVWRAAAPGLGRWVQIVVDAGTVASGSNGVRTAWERFFRAGEAGPAEPLPARPLVRSAELRLTGTELDPDCPRLGDAAIAMDPLSGQGLFWAFSSALAAPPLIRAILDGDWELARRFYRDRLVETFWRQARIGRDFHRLVADWEDAPYWRERRDWPDQTPAHPAVAGPSLSRRVVVKEGRLTEAETLVTPLDPGGVAFLYGREIAPLLRRLPPGPAPEPEAFHRRVLPEASAEEAARILAWLKSRALFPTPEQARTIMEARR